MICTALIVQNQALTEKLFVRLQGPYRERREPLPPNEYPAAVESDFTLSNLLNMSDKFFSKRAQPLMYN